MQRPDILRLVPSDIAKRIYHSGDNAQITGFQELFVLVNADPSAEELRRLLVNYFNDSSVLRNHLSQSTRIFCPVILLVFTPHL